MVVLDKHFVMYPSLHLYSAYYSSDTEDEEQQHLHHKGHLLRTPNYCWCDKDAVFQFNKVGAGLTYVRMYSLVIQFLYLHTLDLLCSF